jgi:hypothetical protein
MIMLDQPDTSENTADGATKLEAQIQGRLAGQVRGFRLVFAREGLTLHGLAQTYYAKQLAQHAVMEATALPILANEISVR